MTNLKRASALVLVGTTLISASGPGHALGFGRPYSRAILGDTLTVSVPLRLEVGEEITDECLAADVYFGDQKIAATAVRAALQPGDGAERLLRVTTTALIDEPIVTVYLAAGCGSRMTRKFVAFADPPGMIVPSVAEPVPANMANAGDGADKPSPAAQGSRKPSRTRPRVASSSASGTSETAAARSSRDDVAPSSSEWSTTMAGRDARVIPESEGDVRPSRRSESRSGLRAERSLNAAARTGPGSEGAGRLVLDTMEGGDGLELPDLRLTASLAIMLQDEDRSPDVMARRRTAAALWRSLNATPEEMARDRQRIGELEQRLAQLNTEHQRAKQALAEAQGLGGWGKWLALLGLIAVLGVGAAMYLGMRLKSSRKGGEAWWHSQTDSRLREPTGDGAHSDLERTSAFVRTPEPPEAASAIKPAAATASVSPVKPPAAPVTQPAATAGQPAGATFSAPPSAFSTPLTRENLHELVPDSGPQQPFMGTTVPGQLNSRAVEPLREVSVEELIDLEQQAEFFVVLGQDDAAIGLLESHMAQTTGASPLPFLKLLEIYRRLGRRDDYERIQTQFNLRFNAHAPAWDDELQQGHTLEDYPGVVERLQGLWGTPSKAMEVLEKSLTRPDSDADTFELPAYRELLFLYAVARDLSEREPHDRANIDLLLPSLGERARDDDGGATTMPSSGAELEDSGEPLMATRPIKAHPEALPSLNLDFHLDDLPESSGAPVKH